MWNPVVMATRSRPLIGVNKTLDETKRLEMLSENVILLSQIMTETYPSFSFSPLKVSVAKVVFISVF